MEKQNPYLNVYLGPIKEPWNAYCRAMGKKPGAALKEAIEQQLEKAEKKSSPRIYHQTYCAAPTESKVRFEILLTESEKRAVQERSSIERCSMRRWIVDAVRVGLTHEPQFSMDEIDALGESNYQLLAIGRNLNQIARRLNEGGRETISIEKIADLTRTIDKHTRIVSEAISASLERWDIR
jgi:hypothetical protein